MKRSPMIHSLACLVVTASLALGADTPDKAAKPDKPNKPAPASRSGDKDRKANEIPPAVTDGIQALAEEFQAVLKDPQNATSRSESNYFKDKEVTLDADQLLDLLKRRLNSNPRIDAYVKWQLLSIQATPFDDQHAAAALQAYQRAPTLPPRPGSGPRGEQEMMRKLTGLNREQVPAANDQWTRMIDNYMRVIGPTLDYRTELFSRLPKNLETLNAGFADAENRIQMGYPSDDFIRRLLADVRTYAAGLTGRDIARLSQLVGRWSGRQGAKVLEEIQVDKGGRVSFKGRALQFNKREFDALQTDLAQMSQTAS